eukprot:TRINITY_DN1240_c0_g1_i1.p2 TRINITY_DN1240_c0_g1~~TRINITY_DN1240_c0_g1_i1.p2  ORF type:complete len:233 (-),score=44.07 TRINITY_DN1240_c0_g1_i1:127-825(-)
MTTLKGMLKKYLHELVGMTMHANSHDLLVELLGIVGNISLAGMRYAELVANNRFVEFLIKLLVPGFAEDDVLLQVIIVLGTLAGDPNASPYIADQRLTRMLLGLYQEKVDDEEIALQLSFTVFKLLLHEPTRNVILSLPGFVDSILTLADDQNPKIKQFTNKSLDIIAECGNDLMEKVRNHRFELLNKDWISATHGQPQGGFEKEYYPNPKMMEDPGVGGLLAYEGSDDDDM